MIYAAIDKDSAKVIGYAKTEKELGTVTQGLTYREDYVIMEFDSLEKLTNFIEASKQKPDKYPVISKDIDLPF